MTARRPTNSETARGISTTEVAPPSWAAFDALPRAIREVIWTASVSINPISAADYVRLAGAEEAARGLAAAITQEADAFARDYRRTHGHQLPHLAAGATPQRYSDPTPRKPARPGRRARMLD